MILRVEDLDATRARLEAAELAPLGRPPKWLGLDWDEGPDVGGPSSPYVQILADGCVSESSLERLKAAELVYPPAPAPGADIERAAAAPRMPSTKARPTPAPAPAETVPDAETLGERPFAWRFRVPGKSSRVGSTDSWARSSWNPAGLAATSSWLGRAWGRRTKLCRGPRRRIDGRDGGDSRRRPRPEHSSPGPPSIERSGSWEPSRPSVTSRSPSTPKAGGWPSGTAR